MLKVKHHSVTLAVVKRSGVGSCKFTFFSSLVHHGSLQTGFLQCCEKMESNVAW